LNVSQRSRVTFSAVLFELNVHIYVNETQYTDVSITVRFLQGPVYKLADFSNRFKKTVPISKYFLYIWGFSFLKNRPLQIDASLYR
jgi:hypothetical protein